MGESLFRKRRNLVQSAAPRQGTRPQNWIGDGKQSGLQNPVFNGVGFVEAKAPPDPLAGIRPKPAGSNPMEDWIKREREMFTNPPKLTYQQQWRLDHGQNPYNANYIKGVDDLDENGHPVEDNGMQYLANNAGRPQSFNPQNQDVLARASAVLDAVKQDRLNPMYGSQQGYAVPGGNGPGIGGGSPIPGLVGRGLEAASQGLNFAQDGMESYQRGRNALPPVPPGQQVGFAAPGLNTQIQGSPGLRGLVNSVGSGLASAYNSVASALTAPPQMYTGPMENVRPERLSDLKDTPGFRFSWNGAGSGDVPNLADALNDPEGRGPAGTVPNINIWNNGRAMVSPEPGVYDRSQRELDGTLALKDKIDAIRERSQFKYPMAPNSPTQPANPIAQDIQQSYDRTTRQGEIMFEPGATSSGGATKNFRKIAPDELNSTTAGTVNGYNGNVEYVTNPMRATAERKIASSEANARRIVGGGAAADPTNIGGRFGGAYGTELNADATAIAEGRAVRTADGKVVYHTGTQESARAAQLAGKTEREALRNRNNMNVPQAELDRRAAADAQKAARAAKHQAFKDANGGMSYRQYDRMTGSSNGNNALTMKAVREGRLSPEEANYRMQLRAEKALRRSGNPITGGTSQAGRLFPDQTAGRGAQTQAGPNPMSAAAEKFMPGGIVTPDSKQAAQDTLKVMAGGGTAPDGTKVPPSPMFAGLVSSPDNVQGMHFGIQQMVQDGQDLGPNELQNLHAAAVAMQAGYGTPDYDPFDMTYGYEGISGGDKQHTEVFSPMYKELAGMKSPTPEKLSEWWGKFKSRIAPKAPWFGFGAMPGVSETIGGYEYPLPANPMK